LEPAQHRRAVEVQAGGCGEGIAAEQAALGAGDDDE